MNKIVSASLQLILLTAVVMSAGPAAALDGCTEHNCRIVRQNCVPITYPCGENEDGTIVFCMEEVCDDVRVCDIVCPGIPDPDDLPDFPGGSGFPPGDPGDPTPF